MLKTQGNPPAGSKKIAKKPKIVLGAGKHLAFVSETLFDEDLKQ